MKYHIILNIYIIINNIINQTCDLINIINNILFHNCTREPKSNISAEDVRKLWEANENEKRKWRKDCNTQKIV